jgi:hypothetical protein
MTSRSQIWDTKSLNANDAIGEVIVDMGPLYKRAVKQKERCGASKQFLTCTHPAYEGPRGKIEIQIDLIPAEDAREHPGERLLIYWPSLSFLQ